MLCVTTADEYALFLRSYQERLERRITEKPASYWYENPRELALAYDVVAWMTKRAINALDYE